MMSKENIVVTVVLCIGCLILTAGAPRYKVSRADIEKLSPAMQETFAGLQYLMNPYQIRHFLALRNEEQRIRWITLFWKQRDPTATTDKNEMETEHTIRVKLARQFYRSKKWPGWDKRGEVFIRYGAPDYRGKIYGEVSVNRRMSPPREIWYYRGHNMLVSFENFGLKGEYIYAIDPLGSAETISPEFAEFLLYDTKESLTKKIPQQFLTYFATPVYEAPPTFINPGELEEYLAARPREVDDAIDALIDPDRIEMLPKDVSAVFQKEQIEKVANNFEITLESTPSSYPFNFEYKDLPFYFGVDQFRAGDKSNRVDINIEVPIEVHTSGAVSFEETFHAEVVIWNSQYDEVLRKEKDIVVRSSPDVETFANLLPTQISLSLAGGYYRMGVSVLAQKSQHASSYRTAFTCEPFARRFSVSDIVFARRINDATSSSIFTRGALEVIPHPVRAYSRKIPIPIYFEIYNLTLDRQNVASYTIEYKVIPHSKEKKRFWDRFSTATPVVSSKFQSSSFSDNDIQHIFLKTGNLSKGSYDLLITVTDDLSGAVTFRRGTFSLVD
jgi:GWxTD domain-containing protein